VWSGEWGWFGDPGSNAPAIARYAKQEDAHLWGGAWWDWKQSCGDPHMFGDGDSTEPGAISPSLNRFRCPDNAPLGIPASTRQILARPYVRAAPGRIAALESDPATRALTASGSDPDRTGSCRVEIWAPDAASGRPRVSATGVTGVRSRASAGGWLVTGCARDSWRISLQD
jgi:endoglycosylceramidase